MKHLGHWSASLILLILGCDVAGRAPDADQNRADPDESCSDDHATNPLEGIQGPMFDAPIGSSSIGIAWSDARQALYYGGAAAALFRLEPGGEPERFGTEAGFGGLAFDVDGRLHVTQPELSLVSYFEDLDRPETLTVTTSDHQGHSVDFNGPTDLELRSDGTVYFIDPCYPCVEGNDQHRLFRHAHGQVTQEVPMDAGPNDIRHLALSPDEDWLYATGFGMHTGVVWRFPVMDDGSLGLPEILVDGLIPHVGELTVDMAGNLYVAHDYEIVVFDPSGRSWGSLSFDDLETSDPEGPHGPFFVQHLTFGGPDGTTLYAGTTGGLVRFEMTIPGAR